MKASFWREAIRLAAVLLGLASPAQAVPGATPLPHYIRYDQLEIFTTENGLSQNTVRCILQDRQGFLWFGTDDGLDRYDGYRFQAFRHAPDIPAGLPHNRVTALYEDLAGRLWVGTMGGLFHLESETGKFVPVPVGQPPLPPAGPAVRQIHESPREPGVLWVATASGLYRLEPRTGQVRKIKLPAPGPPAGAAQPVSALAEAPDGRLWIGLASGTLGWLDRAGDRFTPVAGKRGRQGGAAGEAIHALACGRDGSILIGSSAGLEILNPDDGSIRQGFLGNPHGIEALLESPDGHIWLGTTRHGLDQYIPGTCFLEHRSFLEQGAHDMTRHILSLCRDRSGNLWLGTGSGGIAKLSRLAQVLLIYTADPNDSFSLPFPSVQAVIEDARGRLWAGGFCGLACARASPDGFRRFQPVDLPGIKSVDACIRAISEDPAHPGAVLWIGMDDKGLWKFDIVAGLATPVLDAPDPHPAGASTTVSALAWDHGGRLWIGSSRGLYCRAPSARTTRRIELGEPAEQGSANIGIDCLLVDRFNSVWAGTEDQGLFRLDQPPGHPPRSVRYTFSMNNPASLSDDRITSIHEDREGNIWVGTFGGGINRFDRDTGAFQRFTTHDGLPSNVVSGIFSDDRGTLWLATREGLSNFVPGSRPPLFRNFSADDGLQKNHFNDNACGRGRNGWLFFGGLSGLTAFQPVSIHPNLQPPPVAVTDFKIFHGKGDSPARSPAGSPVSLDYQDAQFSFEFTALDFTNPWKNRFAYRLQGLETRWTHTGAVNRVAVFYRPEPGEYVFQLRAANSDGVWNDDGWSLPVVIRPPFYRSGWFLTLAALGGLALAVFLARFVVRKYQKKSAERLNLVNTMVEISETERQRIGLELHDNLSHDLVAIAVQCRLLAKKNPGLATETTLIEEKIKAAIQQTRSIARGLFPLALAQNGLPAMLDEIRYMVEKDYQIPCEAGLDQEIQIEDLRIAAHLYYIAREAMLNAARHSGTERMFIGLRRVGGSIVLVVRDYGQGAGSAHTHGAGMGLKIMEYRARLIGGHFEIRQPDGGGTEIVCTAPLSTEPAGAADDRREET